MRRGPHLLKSLWIKVVLTDEIFDSYVRITPYELVGAVAEKYSQIPIASKGCLPKPLFYPSSAVFELISARGKRECR